MRRVLIVVSALTAASCAKTVMFEPTATTTVAAPLPGEFSSTIVPGGSASRSFEASAAGEIRVVLKSTTPAEVKVGLGVGIPRSNGSCALGASVEAVAGAAAQISVAADKGAYCAKVYDLGTLQGALPFTIAISHP